jgi:hypothetical protein
MGYSQTALCQNGRGRILDFEELEAAAKHPGELLGAPQQQGVMSAVEPFKGFGHARWFASLHHNIAGCHTLHLYARVQQLFWALAVPGVVGTRESTIKLSGCARCAL